MRNIRLVGAEFDSASKVRESDEAVILPAILARECVSVYCDGRGYKPGPELRAAAFTLDGAWVVVGAELGRTEHNPTVEIRRRSFIRGQVHDVAFNPQINAVVGDVWFLKAQCDAALLEKARKGELSRDVSCAYFSDDYYEPGRFGDDGYDFVQKNIMFGHVSVGVTEGRCPSPYCGVQMDSAEGFLRVNVRNPGLFACRLSTLAVDAKEGVYALVGKLKKNLQPSGYACGDAVERDFLFDASKGWTEEKANAWVRLHLDTASIPEALNPRSNELDPAEVLARSHRLLNSR